MAKLNVGTSIQGAKSSCETVRRWISGYLDRMKKNAALNSPEGTVLRNFPLSGKIGRSTDSSGDIESIMETVSRKCSRYQNKRGGIDFEVIVDLMSTRCVLHRGREKQRMLDTCSRSNLGQGFVIYHRHHDDYYLVVKLVDQTFFTHLV